MMQVPAIQPNQYQTPLQQPNYNAVKIDINNPQVNTSPQNPITPPQIPQAASLYNSIPAASVYEVPQQSIYHPQAASQPAAVPEMASVPPPVIIQPSVKPTTPVPPEAQPQPVPQSAPTPAPQAIIAPAAAVTPSAVAPTAVSPVTAPAAVAVTPQAVEVKPSETVKPQLDLNEFITKLTGSDYDVQAKTIASVAEIVQNSPQKATELLDVKVVEALLGIMAKDTSKLEGPTPQQLQIREKIISGKSVTDAEKAEAGKTSPMEQAERNKLFAIYTVAMLEKLYASEVEKLDKDKNVVPITELPGAAAIVEQIKNNPNPLVRIAGLDALSFIQRPEYKQDLTTLFSVAKNDKDPNVQKVAELALKKLEQLQAPAPQKQ